jgi:uncharacterized protein YjiS (DUF1127 family)
MENRSMRSRLGADAPAVYSPAAPIHPGLAVEGLAAEGPDWLYLLGARFAAWRADRRQRRRLRWFSDHLLRDVGLTSEDIGISGSQHWLR